MIDGEGYHCDYHRFVCNICDGLRERFPEIEIEDICFGLPMEKDILQGIDDLPEKNKREKAQQLLGIRIFIKNQKLSKEQKLEIQQFIFDKFFSIYDGIIYETHGH